MFDKVSKYLYQTVRYLRSISLESTSQHQRSNSKSNLSNLTQSKESIESASSSIDNKMKRKSKFSELCKNFEIRLENSVKLVNDKVLVKSNKKNEIIIIDDDIEEEFTNLINKNNKKLKKDEKKEEVKIIETTVKFTNITSKIQNVQLNQENRSIKANVNTKETTSVDLNGEVESNDLKEIYKNLKPDNYRIQQVIKIEDLVYFDLGKWF